MANPWQALGQQDGRCQADLRKALNDPNSIQWQTNDGGAHTNAFWTWFKKYYSIPGANPVPGKPTKNVQDVFPEWRFNEAMSSRERNCLLCLYAKLKAEGLWAQINSIQNVNQRAEMDIWPTGGSEQLRRTLVQGGRFHNYCFSNWAGNVWGLRSVKGGTQLHMRGLSNGLVNVHIDLANPADWRCLLDGRTHRKTDDSTETRNQNHTPDAIRTNLMRDRISVPPAVP